jgi:hypothetical protein
MKRNLTFVAFYIKYCGRIKYLGNLESDFLENESEVWVEHTSTVKLKKEKENWHV